VIASSACSRHGMIDLPGTPFAMGCVVPASEGAMAQVTLAVRASVDSIEFLFFVAHLQTSFLPGLPMTPLGR
jgi:hypothetical protein